MIELIILIVLLFIVVDSVIFTIDYDKFDHKWWDILPGTAVYRRYKHRQDTFVSQVGSEPLPQSLSIKQSVTQPHLRERALEALKMNYDTNH